MYVRIETIWNLISSVKYVTLRGYKLISHFIMSVTNTYNQGEYQQNIYCYH